MKKLEALELAAIRGGDGGETPEDPKPEGWGGSWWGHCNAWS